MILRQYYLGCLAQASYLVADERSGRAAIVDPRRDVDPYLEDLETLGLRLDEVILTHLHADFVSGHLELRDRTGCRVRLGADARVEFAFEPARAGDVVDLGAVWLEILETPGHTPESISVIVWNGSNGPARPEAVLTGDTLFVGDVGRPDLAAAQGVPPDLLARELFWSLRGKLLTLPDETLVYPGHGAGSLCGRNLGAETVTTVGEQRRTNYALRPMSEDEFVHLVTADQPETPPYFAHDAELNRQDRPLLPEVVARELCPLPLGEVLRLAASGAQVLDVREPPHHAAAHLPGAVNIGLSGKFAAWAGTLLARDRPIVLIADPGREREAVVRLGRIGYDAVAGYLEGGMAALGDRPDLVQHLPRLTVTELRQRLASSHPPLVIDVRSDAERRLCAIEGSAHVPLPQLPRREGELPRDRDLVVVCASGYRSCIGASVLARDGFERTSDLMGGMAAWPARTSA